MFIRIASFDGGVARSISQLEIMRAIMDQVRQIKHPGDPDKVILPCEYFDAMGGTDTGGLIAIMFSKLRMSVEEAITELGIIVKEVYTTKLEPADKTKKLRDCIEGLLTKRKLSVDLKLGVTKGLSHQIRGFILTERMSDGRKVSLSARHSPITVVEAVLATCALQPEFLPVTLDWEPGGPYKYVGLDLRASNPIYHTITEACSAFGRRKETWIVLLLSLGSGNPGIISCTRSHYGGPNALYQQQQDMAKDERASKILEHLDQQGGYFRFSLQQEPQGRDLDLVIDELGRTAAQTDLYLCNPDTVRRIEDCANAMLEYGSIAENVALTLYTAGRFTHAETAQHQIINERRDRLGKAHPETIRAMEFGVILRSEQRHWHEAQQDQTRVLRLHRDALGTEHPRAVKAAAISAAIYSEQEIWDKAEELQLEILEQKRLALGKDHLESIHAAANLASTYHVQGRWNEARRLWLEVLEGRQRMLGKDHPNTVLAAECLDASLRAPKEAETARRWKLDLTEALEGAANGSLGAMVDAESDSSYPRTSLNAYATGDSSANSGTGNTGGQSNSVAPDVSRKNPPVSPNHPSHLHRSH